VWRSGAGALYNNPGSNMDKNINRAWEKIEDQVRADPLKAVLIAFATGFAFCLLPVGRLTGFVAKLAFLLLKPALFVLGIIKALEYAGLNVAPRK
jgi:hypothetical protein